MGAAIIMGTQFGAKDYETLKREISTTLISGSIFSLTLTILGIIFAGPLLRLMRVHDDIYILTLEYIRIIFMGLGFTFLYNFFASSLRALGDSTRPLYFLIISAILNVFGDLALDGGGGLHVAFASFGFLGKNMVAEGAFAD